MKATGIVRKIDNLGRVVIPKELRRNLNIDEGTNLEIFVDRKGKVILKKYSPLAEIELLDDYVETLAKTTECDAMVVDTEKVIASSINNLNHKLGKGTLEALEQRKTILIEKAGAEEICKDCGHDDCPIQSAVISPIIRHGDIFGAVILSSADKTLGEYEMTIARAAANILAKQARV
ncbi:AbrB family transcriptional regulator [Anoxybacter fermentans]|uniref:AbrB family transcriptional regulator n=1 Tax=Anoxybacter fermentans TaxID=1323375 RepID=A0A3Q9HSA7_9FIRM|nr:stage V sporulation T C-terminal domain-containing protein [Anoxybacter fermentans]AZR74130.1 AbrB family transcriptional regulator [Anoxybacter fermentans]